MNYFFLLFLSSSCLFHQADVLVQADMKPSAQRGLKLTAAYGCASCHEIKDISENPGTIGPPLIKWKYRKYIAGKLPNNKKNLRRWLRHPQEVDAGTAMPDLGITEAEAVDISAYLFSQ